jgi:hypothetical protein
MLNDRNINTHMLQRHRFSPSLRAVVKDKTSTESKSSGYHLGVVPYLYRVDKNNTGKLSSTGSSTSTISIATNSTTTPFVSTDTTLYATAQDWKDSNTFIDNSSNSTTILLERPELTNSASSIATNASATNAVNTTTTITSDSKTVKAEAEVSWQDKYFNRFRYQKAVATSKDRPQTKTPPTSASASRSSNSRGNSKTPLASSVSQKQVNKTPSSKESKEPTPLVPGKKPSDVLTVEDLESFLMTNGFVKRSELEASQQATSSATVLASTGVAKSGGSAAQTFKTDGSSGSGVALPQPSVLSYKDLKWGTAVSAGFLGLLVGLSILPNLWLVGVGIGFLYGWDIGKKIPDGSPGNALDNLLVSLGRKLSKSFLTVYDATNAVFFMYKTGELSYAYYKRFSVLDDRFKIQSKIDAWNSRFAEGKLSFDAWERENEIGRKALAVRIEWNETQRSPASVSHTLVLSFIV